MDAMQSLRLRLLLEDKEGAEFQDFFNEVLTKTLPGFRRMSPSRDGGNDGWIPNVDEGTAVYFQVYAPASHQYSHQQATKKMVEDGKKLHVQWHPQLKVRAYLFVVKCPRRGLTAAMQSRMKALCSELGFEVGDVLRAQDYLTERIENSSADVQELLTGPRLPVFGQGADAEGVRRFMDRVWPPIERLVRTMWTADYPLVPTLQIAALRDVVAHRDRRSADDREMAKYQRRMIEECRNLLHAIEECVGSQLMTHEAGLLKTHPYGQLRPRPVADMQRHAEMIEWCARALIEYGARGLI